MNLQVPPELEAKLTRLAAERGRTTNWPRYLECDRIAVYAPLVYRPNAADSDRSVKNGFVHS